MTAPLEMSVTTFRPAAKTTEDTANYALVRLTVPQQANLGETYAELMLVLDRSGSMFHPPGDRPIDKVIEAVRAVINALRPRDRLGFVTFDDSAKVYCPLTPGESKRQLLDKLAEFEAECRRGEGGGTSMAPALSEAVKHVRASARDARAARIVILTDGQAGDADATLSYVRTLERQNVAALGFGGFDFNFMNQVCEPSKGMCEEATDPGQVKEKFMDELKVAQDTVASNLRLRVRATDYVRLRKSYLIRPRVTYLGKAQTGPDRTLALDLPPLEKSFGIDVLLDLVHLRRDVGTYSAAEVSVLYDIPSLKLKDQELVDNVVVEYTADSRKLLEANAEVKAAFERGLDEELRLELEKADKTGDAAKAEQVMASIRKSSNSKFVVAAESRKKGGADAAKQMQQESRKKT